MPPWTTVLWGTETTLLFTLRPRGNNDLCGGEGGDTCGRFPGGAEKSLEGGLEHGRVSDKEDSRKKEHW